MSLQIWLPLNKQGDYTNRGLCYDAYISNPAYTYNASGKTGGCLHATRTEHKYIPIQGVDVKDFMDKYINNHSFSLSAWIKTPLSNSGERSSIINLTYGVNLKLQGLWLYNRDRSVITSYDRTVYDNKWHHIVGVYNVENNMMYFYVDGDLKASKLYHETERYSSSWNNALRIGNDSNNESVDEVYFDGDFSDIRIYDHALSQEEVKELSQGLVLHYKLDDLSYTSTTNLIKDVEIPLSCHQRTTDKYGFGEGTDAYLEYGHFQGRDCYKITNKGVINPYHLYPYIKQLNYSGQNKYKTVSFWYYPTIGDTMTFYDNRGASIFRATVNGEKQPAITSPGWYTIHVNTNQWNRVVVTCEKVKDDTSALGYFIIPSHEVSSSNYWLFADLQVEDKNYDTIYTSTTRTESYICDSSGYNTDGTITGDLLVQNDSPRYDNCVKFNSSCIGLENLPMFTDNKISISFWMKPADTTTVSCLLNYRSAVGQDLAVFLIDSVIRFDVGGQTYFRNYYYTTEWQHVVLTYDGSYKRLYINGELTQSVANTTNISISATKGTIGKSSTNTTVGNQDNIYGGELSDYRIYSTALSADDVKDLYETSASIDNRGTLHAREIVENTENLFTLEKLLETINPAHWVPGSNDNRDPRWVIRNGQEAIRICPHLFYYFSDQDSTGLLSQSHLKKYFKPGKQYKFDFWIDVDDNYYTDNGVLKTSYAGIGLSYTDGTEIYGHIYNDLNSPKGFQHKVYYSDPTKTIQGIYFHYNTNTPGYYRSDSSITEVKDVDVQKCGIVEAPWLVDTKAITGTRSQYDTNIYEEPDGSRWVRVFHHANPSSSNLFSSTDSFATRVYGNSDRWFDVSICNQLSSWELMIKQKPSSSDTLQKYRWKQQVNPMLATSSDVSADKVTYNTSTGYTSCAYKGLFKFNGNTYLTQGDYWFGAIGSWSVFQSGIPGWNKKTISSTGYMDLYVRIDDTFQKETNIYDNKIECNSFIEN